MALAIPITHPILQPQDSLGHYALTYKEGSLTPKFVFHVANPDRYCACAQHFFGLSLTLLGRLSLKLRYWATDTLQTFSTYYIFWSKMRMRS